MTLLLILLAASAATEILLWGVRPLWRTAFLRHCICALAIALMAYASVGLVVLQPNVLTSLVAFTSAYRVLNMVRVAKGRMNERYLRQVTRRSSIVLLTLQAGFLVLLAVLERWLMPLNVLLWVWAIGLVAVAATALGTTIRRLLHTRLLPESTSLTSSHLPTVTVAIPARNETDSLHACLTSLTHSNYPKLEILVLDDCSQLRRTPEIIRQFAHDGVRFVRGEPPRDTWLAKNQAYEKLTQEASGDIMLFAGVDMRFEPDTIRQLVALMFHKQKRMISILPTRHDHRRLQYSLVQAARYVWELAPPRRLFRRPPVLSSCWLIYRKDLQRFGGFAAVARAILPEAYFANCELKGDNYSFMRGSLELGLWSAKSHADQRSTAVRTRYPQLHRKLEAVLLLTWFELFFLLGPFVLAGLGVAGLVPLGVGLLSGVAAVALTAAYVLITQATKVNSWFIAPLLPALVTLTDIALTHISLCKYEFSEVIWKGRNICLPVMHVVSHLPNVDDERITKTK